MARTSTQEKPGSPLVGGEGVQRRRRIAAAALVVAAAVIAAAVAGWLVRGDTEQTRPEPTGAAGPDPGAVAASFIEAIYAHDPDRAEGMLRVARSSGAPLALMDAQHLGVRSESVDAVLLSFCLFRLLEPRRGVAEAGRVL